jgi:O-antigen/teichoic acid export membrane protein
MATPATPASPPEPGDSVARNAAFAFATQITTAAFTAGITVFLGRALDPTGYGHFALALGIATVVVFLADLGISAATPRFIAERRDDRRAVAAVLSDALKLKAAASGVICALLFVLADPIATAFNAPAATWPLRGVAISIWAQGLVLLVLGSFQAVGRIAVNFRIVASESAVEASAIVALVLLGGGATGAAFGRAAGYVTGAAIALAFAWRALGGLSLRSGGRAQSGVGLRQIAGYAGALLIIDGLFRLFSEIDVLLIAAILGGGASVGLFELPMKLAWFLHYPVGAASTAVAPRLARRAGAPPQREVFASALRYLVVFQGVFLAPIVVWADPLVDLLLGAQYEESADVLRALAPFVFLSGPAVLVSLGVNYLGEARRRIPLAVGALLVNVAVDVALLREIGIVAAAIGTDLAYLLWVPGHLLIIRSLLGIPLRPIALATGRALLAAAAACGLLVLLGTGDVALPVLIAGCVGACAVYLAALALTGELSRSDVRLFRELVGRQFAWAAPRG